MRDPSALVGIVSVAAPCAFVVTGVAAGFTHAASVAEQAVTTRPGTGTLCEVAWTTSSVKVHEVHGRRGDAPRRPTHAQSVSHVALVRARAGDAGVQRLVRGGAARVDELVHATTPSGTDIPRAHSRPRTQSALVAHAEASAQHCAATQVSHATESAGGTMGTMPPHAIEQGATHALARHATNAPSDATSDTLSVSHAGSHVWSRGSQPSVQSSRGAQLDEPAQAATLAAHASSTHDTHSLSTELRFWMPASCRHAGATDSAATRTPALRGAEARGPESTPL